MTKNTSPTYYIRLYELMTYIKNHFIINLIFILDSTFNVERTKKLFITLP